MDNFEKMSSKKIKRKAKELFDEMPNVELVSSLGTDSKGHPIYRLKLSNEDNEWTRDVKSPSSTGSSSNWLKRLKSQINKYLRAGPSFRAHGSDIKLSEDDIFDRAPKRPDDFFRRRPKNPEWGDIEKSWWDILKQVDIDFTFIKPLHPYEQQVREMLGDEMGPLETGGWAGLYDRMDNKIWINLSSWKGTSYQRVADEGDLEDFEQVENPLRSKEGHEGITGNEMELQVQEEIIETIMHEAGHAAALSQDHADLNDEIQNWVYDKLAEHMDFKEDATETQLGMYQRIGGLIDYLIHEYIAAICERREQPGPIAMKNAWDQTVGSQLEKLYELTGLAQAEWDESPSNKHGYFAHETPANLNWEFAEHLLPIFNKYFNKMSDKIFTAYKEGTSHREKRQFEELTGEKAKPKTRGTMESLFNPDRRKKIQEEQDEPTDWMSRLRGR